MTKETARASTVQEPFSTKPLWHTPGLHLPPYIQHVAHDLLEAGHAKDEQMAIKMAVGIVRAWKEGRSPNGRGHVHPDVQAAAARAWAQWESDRAAAHAHSRSHEHTGGKRMNADLARHTTVEKDDESLEVMPDNELAEHYENMHATYGEQHPATKRVAGHIAKRTKGAATTKSDMVHHLREIHRLSGSHEEKMLHELHTAHSRDHATGNVPHHQHRDGIAPKRKASHQPKASSNLAMHFDEWGQRIDLATSTVRYANGTRVIHHSAGKKKGKGKRIGFKKLVSRLKEKGYAEEDAKAIAANVGRRKYGKAKFEAMAHHGE